MRISFDKYRNVLIGRRLEIELNSFSYRVMVVYERVKMPNSRQRQVSLTAPMTRLFFIQKETVKNWVRCTRYLIRC